MILWAPACGDEASHDQGPHILYPATHTETMQQEAEPLPTSTWAMRWSIPVRWGRNIGIESGSGTLVYYAKSTATHDGAVRTDAVRLCGMAQPSYKLSRLLGNETYQTQYHDALFDDAALPTFPLTFKLGEEGSFAAAPAALQLGVALDNPTQAPWPAYGQPLPGKVLEQADGQPGIATHMRTDGGYIAPPVDMFRARRAETFHIALRHLLGANGGLSDEGFGEGQARVGGMGGKAALNTRVLGCQLSVGSACGASELYSLNTYNPTYVVAGHGSFVMMRIPSDATCATIRSLTYERGGANAL